MVPIFNYSIYNARKHAVQIQKSGDVCWICSLLNSFFTTSPAIRCLQQQTELQSTV